MQSIVQGTSPIWSKNMTRIKSTHFFEIGELVIPHPIIHFAYKDIEKMEFGIVVKRINPKHPVNDYRKVRVFWQKQMREETYYAHQLFHLHHEEQVDRLYELWESKKAALNVLSSKPPFSHHQIQWSLENLGDIINERFPINNPCKGIV